jgi:hypothetical protein
VSLPRKRSAVGNAAKRYKSQPDDERRAALEDARRELTTGKLEVHIRSLVDQAPELSTAQREKLALLLRAEQR